MDSLTSAARVNYFSKTWDDTSPSRIILSPDPEVIELFSAEIVGIFVFISRENFMLSYIKQERIWNC